MNTFTLLYIIGAVLWTAYDLVTSYRYVNTISRPYFVGYLVTNVLLWWVAFPLHFFEDSPRS